MAKTSPVSKAKVFADLPYEHRECIDEYIMNHNMVDSYKRFVKPDNDNYNSVASQAQQFFKKKNILAIIDERKSQLATCGSMEKQEIIKRIEDIANGIAEDQFSDKTSIKDQLAALNMLCKINGIIDDKPTINNTIQQVFVDDVRE